MTPTTPGVSQTYFAAETDENRLASALMQRWRDYQEWLQVSGRLSQMRTSYQAYYGFAPDGRTAATERVKKGGRRGQVLRIRVPHYASLLRAMVTLITAQKPAFVPKVKNTDSDSTAKATVAENVLEEAFNEKGLTRIYKRWVAHAARYRAGYADAVWDADMGPKVKPEVAAQQPLERDPITLEPLEEKHEGDVRCGNYTPTDVAYDFLREDDKHEWLTTRRLVNKHDLVAKLKGDPETVAAKRGRILNLSPSVDELATWRLSGSAKLLNTVLGASDLIPVYEFWHLRTPAVPKGRHVIFVAEDCVLLAEGNGYVDAIGESYLPVVELTPDDLDDQAGGHSPIFDILGLQEGLDAVISSGLTKVQKRQPITLVDHKAGLERKDIEAPYSVYEVNGRPSDMADTFEPSASGAEDFAAGDKVQRHMETITGINSVSRGDPEGSMRDASGKALAFVQAQAILAQTDFQSNAHDAWAKHAGYYLRAHQLFNRTQRALRRGVGSGHETALAAFSGADIEADGVSVEGVAPLQQTTAGKERILQALADRNVPMTGGQVVAFLKTGEWDNALEDSLNEDQFIRQENEALARGQQIPVASMGEDHVLHILSHRPKTLKDKLEPVSLGYRLDHMASHAALLFWPGLAPETVQQLAKLGLGPPPAPMAPGPEGDDQPHDDQPRDDQPPPANGAPPGGGGGEPPESHQEDGPGLPTLPDGSEVNPIVQAAAAQGPG